MPGYNFTPRPLTEQGLLVAETARMLPLSDQDRMVLDHVVSGSSKAALQEVCGRADDSLRQPVTRLMRALDARTWPETVRISVELGALAVSPEPRNDEVDTCHMSERALDMQAEGSRGLPLPEIALMRGYTGAELRRTYDQLLSTFDVSRYAFAPQAVAMYRWYARSPAALRPANPQLRWRNAVVRPMHLRGFLAECFPAARFEHLPDALVPRCLDALQSLLPSVLSGYSRQKKIMRLTTHIQGTPWSEIAEQEGVSLEALAKMRRGIQADVTKRITADGFVAYSGLDVRLPLTPPPPLVRGLPVTSQAANRMYGISKEQSIT